MNCRTILEEYVALNIFQITLKGWMDENDAFKEPDHDKLAWVLINADSLEHPTVRKWFKHENVMNIELLESGLLTARELLKEGSCGVDYFIPDQSIEFNEWLNTGKKKERVV